MQLKPIGRERTHLINDSYGKDLTSGIYLSSESKNTHSKKSKTVNRFFFSFKGDKKGRVCVEATGFLWMKNKKIHLRRLNWKTPMTPRQINQKEENKTQRKMDAQNPTNVSRGVMEQCMLDYECLRPEQSGWQNPDRENLEKKITRRNTFDATDLRCFFFHQLDVV